MFLSHSCVDEAFCLKRSLAGKQISSITADHFPLGILFLLHSYHISTFTSSTYTASHATTRLHAALQYFASAKKSPLFIFSVHRSFLRFCFSVYDIFLQTLDEVSSHVFLPQQLFLLQAHSAVQSQPVKKPMSDVLSLSNENLSWWPPSQGLFSHRQRV